MEKCFITTFHFKIFNNYDLISTGGWVWDDRTPVDYVNWANGEPNGAENGENCAELYDDEYGKWNDEDCLNNAGYVCVMSQCK